jgi:LPXTG-motif cell wall-anchored protein
MTKKKKTWKALILALVTALLLTGCVDASMHITINMNGSGTYEVKVLSNEWVLPQFDHLKERLQQGGYQLQEIEEGGKQGWIAVKNVESVLDEPPGKVLQEGANTALRFLTRGTASATATDAHLAAEDPPIRGLGKELRVENSLFTTTLLFDTNVDLTRLDEKMKDLGGLNQFILDQINLNFILTLPVKVDEHNATAVSDGGKTLTWKLKPGEKNPIHMAIRIPNPITWGILMIVGLILLIIAVVVLIRRRRKRNRRDGDDHFPPGGSSPDHNPSPDSFRWG